MSEKDMVCIGFFSPDRDGRSGDDRWGKWRPTLEVCRNDEHPVSRLELLHEPKFKSGVARLTEDIEQVSPGTDVRRVEVGLNDPWDFSEVYSTLRDLFKDYDFEPDKREYLVHLTTGTHVIQICLFLLCASRHIPGKLLQTTPPEPNKTGAKPWSEIDLNLQKYESIRRAFRGEFKEDVSYLKLGIETRNARFNRLMEQVREVALRSDAPLLLTGDTGTGKTLLARRIYEIKKAHNVLHGDLVEVNCATLHGDLASSALFGHVQGAFTGASTDREGLLKRADTGLLFLDEVVELGPDEQSMLLKAVEDKRFLPMGADDEVESDFSLICATNRNIHEAVRRGEFRDDLLARISLWEFELPPLRDRPEDIEPNIDLELKQYASRHNARVVFTQKARARYLRFAREAEWPGNFRDLHASVVRMATLAREGKITIEVVKTEIERVRAQASSGAQMSDDFALVCDVLGQERASAIDLFERVQLAEVIRVCRRSKTLAQAGRKLFAHSRQQKESNNDSDRVSKYLKRYGIDGKEL